MINKTYSITKSIPMSDANAENVYDELRKAIAIEFCDNDDTFDLFPDEMQDALVDQYLVDFVKWVIDNHVTKN